MMTPAPGPEERRAIITITKPGLALARKLKAPLHADLYVSERYAGPDDPDIRSFDGVVKNLLPDLFTRNAIRMSWACLRPGSMSSPH